jgi:hypothetical protein
MLCQEHFLMVHPRLGKVSIDMVPGIPHNTQTMRGETLDKSRMPLNTLDRALALSQVLSRDLSRKGSKAYHSFRIFTALAQDEREALAAFLIWRARGETLKELFSQQ